MTEFINEAQFRINLMKVRTAKGYNQEELGKACKFTNVKRINDFERGRISPRLSELDILCHVLDVNIDDMLRKKVELEINFKPI